MRFNTLDAWLEWQATLNPKEIVLGLDRVTTVLKSLDLPIQFNCPLIMVAGTNGKGSVVAMIEAISRAQGLKVATYTSPHINQYNERINIDGKPVSDDTLCESFQRIDIARGDITLTYFEFGTLAAIDCFFRAPLDLVIMEIGLGGRLDAVNIMQPDVSIITTVDIDHIDWLGDTREKIGLEKAGIFREKIPVICGDVKPPKSVMDIAKSLNTECYVYDTNFKVVKNSNDWSFYSDLVEIEQLPYPNLQGDFQIQNAAVAIMAIAALHNKKISAKLTFSESFIKQGLTNTQLNGRYQCINQNPDVFVDVAHNVQAAQSLSHLLAATKNQYKRTYCVIAMLADKDVAAVIKQITPNIDHWCCAGLDSVSRGMSANKLYSVFEELNLGVKLRTEMTVAKACNLVVEQMEADDRLIVFGSFYTVSQAMQYFES